MAGHQPYHPTLDKLNDLLISCEVRKSGCRTIEEPCDTPFVSRQALRTLVAPRVPDYLKAIYDTQDPGKLPAAKIICESYLITFVILFSIGCGADIEHFVRHDALADNRLPHTERPRLWPPSRNEDDFQRFRDKQWAFCPFKFEMYREMELEESRILPIINKEDLDDGENAFLRTITIDDEYNDLRGSGAKSGIANSAVFSVKTFKGANAEVCYANETQAFKVLQRGSRPLDCVIGYYGSFKQDGLCNMLIEDSGGGTLEDLIHNDSPPKSAPDIFAFWTSLLCLSRALVSIDNMRAACKFKREGIFGWDHNIRPSNILIFEHSGSKWGQTFKIADLGIVTFEQEGEATHGAKFLAGQGTRTYDAPEIDNLDLSFSNIREPLDQRFDIWSLGCIYSVVATWVVHDSNFVRDYAQHRSKEIEKAVGVSNIDCFHSGRQVLPFIKAHHDRIGKNVCEADKISARIVQKLSNWMLCEPHVRPTGRQATVWSNNIVKSAKHSMWRNSHTSGHSHDQAKRSGHTTPISSSSSTELFDEGQRTSNEASFESYERANVDNIDSYGSDCQDEIRPISRSTDPHDASAVPEPYFVKLHSLTADAEKRIVSSAEPLSSPSRVRSSLKPQRKPMRLNRTLHSHRHKSSCSDICTRKPSREAETDSQCPGLTNESSSSKWQRPHEEDGKLRMNLNEALVWKRTCEPGASSLHQDMLSTLEDCHHAFLIDRGWTMQRYEAQVADVLEILYHLAESSKPKSIDLRFTTSRKKYKPKNNMNAVEILTSMKYDYSEMKGRFDDIIEAYQNKLGGKHRLRHKLFDRGHPLVKPRKYCLYVLTDGLWLSWFSFNSDIKNLMSKLKEHDSVNSQLGIQFIRFGQVREGKSRLQWLENYAKKMYGLDLIDTTEADGNVYKMLLGSVNELYGND